MNQEILSDILIDKLEFFLRHNSEYRVKYRYLYIRDQIEISCKVLVSENSIYQKNYITKDIHERYLFNYSILNVLVNVFRMNDHFLNNYSKEIPFMTEHKIKQNNHTFSHIIFSNF